MKVRLIYGLVIFIIVYSIERYIDHQNREKLFTNIELVNIAGKQRMYSQKITKLALYANESPFKLLVINKELEDAYHQFSTTHNKLSEQRKKGKSDVYLDELFTNLESYYQEIMINTIVLIENTRNGVSSNNERTEEAIETIKKNENQFLHLMDKIVNQYEKEGKAIIEVSAARESTFNIIFIALLAYIVFFVLLPDHSKKGGNVFNF
ncbi:type IV pili methyl-accepting chemotaxis transducer N-terminal domain-containing protein [Polaribacter sp. MED152]|uniref:type IV pili methyl-accepting chemotaxis transducer N-terminal domain-containing protein n=1 Tax=Polaribacter sp. MED152 TaxID=313598 RepID=UPI000068C8FD|nr:type IV pili methyl-accepting chemotaxis transducer N-terminal domain-containing protein [Polaribacter sp. MED152]EAQ42482.1 hypothetical protein MED152_07170 [Polaribacter sp. MED152]